MSTAINDIPSHRQRHTRGFAPWTSRVSSKWGDQVLQVEWDPDMEDEPRYSGGETMRAVGSPAMAGWHKYAPCHSRGFATLAVDGGVSIASPSLGHV